MEYTVIFHEAQEGGYWADVPALPGCYSQGETIEETMENMREAIESRVEALKEDGQEIPKESSFVIGRLEVSTGGGI